LRNARLSQPKIYSGDHLRRSFADTARANVG
jgi:predicted metal-dependent HD superfamily phosphohydrolase